MTQPIQIDLAAAVVCAGPDAQLSNRRADHAGPRLEQASRRCPTGTWPTGQTYLAPDQLQAAGLSCSLSGGVECPRTTVPHLAEL